MSSNLDIFINAKVQKAPDPKSKVKPASVPFVDGWYWHATLLSPRTCLSCIRQHGTWHPSTEVLNDHYNGRCAAIPAVKGFSNPIAQTGEEWFNSLSDAKQRELMGERMHDLYKKGAFSFGDLTVEKEDRVYGAMKTRASLEELLSKKA